MLFIYLFILSITAKQFDDFRPSAPQEDPKNIIASVLKQLENPPVKNRMPDYLPNEANSGYHGLKQFYFLMKQKGLTYQESKVVFDLADEDKDNKISDREFQVFYRLIIIPYESCLEDDDYFMGKNETLKCYKDSGYFNSTNKNITDISIDKIFSIMSSQELNLYNYIFLRKVEKAFQKCASNNQILGNKLFCGLQITSPRIGILDQASEKQLFITGSILSTGYNSKSTQTLTFLEFFEVSYFYNFFIDYEIPVENGFIRKQDVLRAQQENMLDLSFLPTYAYQFFEDMDQDKYSVSACLGMFYIFRNWVHITDGFTLQKSKWIKFVQSESFPSRLINAFNTTFIPTQEEYEIASARLFDNKTDDNLMFQLDNLIFLQTKNKLNLKKQYFEQKNNTYYNYSFNYPADAQQNIVKFPNSQDQQIQSLYHTPFLEQKTGLDIIFNQFDKYQNNSMCFKEWVNFIRISFLFSHFNRKDQKQINWQELLNNEQRYIVTQENPFPLSKTQKMNFLKFQDYMQDTYSQFINIKQFYAYFQKDNVCSLILQQKFQYISPKSKTDQCIYTLGLRITDYNQQTSPQGFSGMANEITIKYYQAFEIAFKEDVLASYIKLQQEKSLNSTYMVKQNKKQKEQQVRFKNLRTTQEDDSD